ncbi:MAG: O-antigen ligase family protein [Actinobacteria bacterium]|nr:O-antigen ligase family protein [Actinomycetota bacterium]
MHQRFRLPALWSTAWPAVLGILMILGTEYKFRLRELDDSLSATVDLAILVELGIYAFVTIYLVAYVANPPRWYRPTAIQFFMRAYAAAMLASVVYSTYFMLGAVRGAQLCVMVIYATAVAGYARRQQVLMLAHAYVALVTASVFVGLVYRVPYSELQANRFNWLYVHSVTAGAMLALGITVALGLATNHSRFRLGGSRWPRPLYVVALLVMTAALVATQTRGALAACVVGVFVVIFLTVPARERLPLGVLGLAGLGLTVAAFWDTILTYVTRGESAESLATVNSRTELWALAYELVLQRPLTGWGLTASRGVFYDKIGLGGAHNAFVNVAVDGGLLGLGLWLALVVAIGVGIARLQRIRHADAPLLGGTLACLLVNGLTVEGVGTGTGVSALWLLILGAWVGVLQREVGRSQRSHEGGFTLTSLAGERLPETPLPSRVA